MMMVILGEIGGHVARMVLFARSFCADDVRLEKNPRIIVGGRA